MSMNNFQMTNESFSPFFLSIASVEIAKTKRRSSIACARYDSSNALPLLQSIRHVLDISSLRSR